MTKLHTILKNLISNALKFSVPNDIVKISALERETTVEIQIYDSGRGIHYQDLPYMAKTQYSQCRHLKP